MAVNLSIKDVPDQLADNLRQRAARNHRSLQGELMAIIESAAQAGGPLTPPPASLPSSLTASQTASLPSVSAARSLAGTRRGHLTVEQTAAALRDRFPQPILGGPLAVDIIRADRDSL